MGGVGANPTHLILTSADPCDHVIACGPCQVASELPSNHVASYKYCVVTGSYME